MLEQMASTSQATFADVEALHRRCGVYTRDSVVCMILDAVGWSPDVDLSDKRILEPAAGDGAFVVEIAHRLLESLSSRGKDLALPLLAERIVAFEIHPGEAAKARERVIEALLSHGLTTPEADAIARIWVRVEDFLLADLDERSFTHVVGNPPYSRWSKIPAALKTHYEAVLPRRMTKGDLFLPFLDLGIGYLEIGGRLGFICSNRWRYMAFAEGFRQTRFLEVSVEIEDEIDALDAFFGKVDTYPSIVVMQRKSVFNPGNSIDTDPGRRTLAGAGYSVRVGPALGISEAFVIQPGEYGVEEELEAAWVDVRQLRRGEIGSYGHKVISVFDGNGKIRDIDMYPKARTRFEKFKPKLVERSIVKSGAVWYRTIDRIIVSDWRRPKLLVPEVSKSPQATLDLSGAVPSHGIYAIFAPDDDFSVLQAMFSDGGLEKRLRQIAPKTKGNYLRCYKRFLDRITFDEC